MGEILLRKLDIFLLCELPQNSSNKGRVINSFGQIYDISFIETVIARQ